MLADGIIEPCAEEFSSAIVVAGKPEKYRSFLDYRRLNDQIEDAPQCLPRIHEVINFQNIYLIRP